MVGLHEKATMTMKQTIMEHLLHPWGLEKRTSRSTDTQYLIAAQDGGRSITPQALPISLHSIQHHTKHYKYNDQLL